MAGTDMAGTDMPAEPLRKDLLPGSLLWIAVILMILRLYSISMVR